MIRRMKYVFYCIWSDHLREAITSSWERLTDNIHCFVYGHSRWETEEDEYLCGRCFAGWPWLPEHEWIKSNSDCEKFLAEVAITHKRRFDSEW